MSKEEKDQIKTFKFIEDVIFTPEKGTSFTSVKITVNLVQQKEAYNLFYKELAKEIKMPGFRQGHIPRNIVEPKVYPNATKKTQQYLAERVLEDITPYIKITSEQYLIDIMDIKEANFTLVDTPMTLVIRVLMVDASLGKISDIKLDKSSLENIKIDPKDIKKTIKRVWENWQKKNTSKELTKKYPKINNEWIKEVLIIKGVEDIDQLKNYVEKQLIDNKREVAKELVLKDLLQKARKTSNFKLPDDYLQEIIKREKSQAEEQLKKNNLTLEKYLKTQKKVIKDFEQDIIDQTNDQVLTELLFRVYRKTNNVFLDRKDSEDKLYIEEAKKYIKPPQKSKDGDLLKYIEKIMETALNIKSQILIAKEVGLNLINDPKDKKRNKKEPKSTK